MSDPNIPKDAGDTAPAEDKVDKSNQPSILNIKSIPKDTLMRVESDVLAPLTFSQSEAVWELQPKGFLHPNSALEIGFDVNGTLTRAFPFIGVGIHSIVRRAVLRTTAGRVINDTDDWNKLQAVNSMFLNNSSNKNREQYTSGRQLDFEVTYAEGSDTNTTPRGVAGNVVAGTGGYGLSNNYEYCEIAPAQLDDGEIGSNVQNHLLNSAESTFQIKLHELFPYFKAGNQMPLFLLPNEKIQVVLYWADTAGTNRLAISSADEDAGRTDEAITLARSKCKFIADYTFYEGKIMEKFRDDYKDGMEFAYNDTRLSKQTLTAANALSNVRNLGGNGMVVDNVVWNYNVDTGGETSLLGSYVGDAPTVTAAVPSRNLLTSNVFINSEFLFPQSVSNPARHFHNLKEATGRIPFVSRQCYSGQGIEGSVSGVLDRAFEGRDQVDNLSSKFFHQGFRLEGLSTRINNSGIQLHSDAITGATVTQRAWLDIKRRVVISDGHLECYFI